MEKEMILTKNSLSSLSGRSTEETIRFNLFSVVTTIILSDAFFKKNSDIEAFFKETNVEFKPYVFNSRTLIIARMTRYIESADYQELQAILKSIKDLVFDNSTIYINKNKNDIDDILNQFDRK